VMYVVDGQTFWDSNFGANYRIECHVEESPLPVRRVDAAARLTKESSPHPFYWTQLRLLLSICQCVFLLG